jgi:hypothetical protein
MCSGSLTKCREATPIIRAAEPSSQWFPSRTVAKEQTERIQELVAGDKLAMEAFFTFIDGLQRKSLGKDGESAIVVVAGVVELLLPMQARHVYAVASKKENKKPARPRKKATQKRRR